MRRVLTGLLTIANGLLFTHQKNCGLLSEDSVEAANLVARKAPKVASARFILSIERRIFTDGYYQRSVPGRTWPRGWKMRYSNRSIRGVRRKLLSREFREFADTAGAFADATIVKFGVFALLTPRTRMPSG